LGLGLGRGLGADSVAGAEVLILGPAAVADLISLEAAILRHNSLLAEAEVQQEVPSVSEDSRQVAQAPPQLGHSLLVLQAALQVVALTLVVLVVAVAAAAVVVAVDSSAEVLWEEAVSVSVEVAVEFWEVGAADSALGARLQVFHRPSPQGQQLVVKAQLTVLVP